MAMEVVSKWLFRYLNNLIEKWSKSTVKATPLFRDFQEEFIDDVLTPLSNEKYEKLRKAILDDFTWGPNRNPLHGNKSNDYKPSVEDWILVANWVREPLGLENDPIFRGPLKIEFNNMSDKKYKSGKSQKEVMDSNEYGSKENINSASKENAEDSNCDSPCPITGSMVCAKCEHGIYKTFLSTCHMKKFLCDNSAEKLELVSRNACVLSAPFFTSAMSDKSNIRDHDRVLRYLECRAKGKLDGNGPDDLIENNCDFDDD